MSGAGTDQSSAEISDEMLAEIVRHLRPSWTPMSIDHIVEGVNSTVAIDVDTPMGEQRIVLKASTSTHPLAENRSRAEPRVLSLLKRKTAVPVPTVFDTCDAHETYPTPYFLMEYIDGETISAADVPNLPFDIRETIFRKAGLNLAELHTLGSLDEVGDLVGKGGKVSVLDTPESPSYDTFHDWLLDSYEETLDQLVDDGGYFPELTENPNRFDDFVPEIRDYLRETIPDLSPPQPPTYCHKDYGYWNLVVAPETGETRAVLDWANLMSAPPEFNLAIAESKLLKPNLNTDASASAGRAGELRRALWGGYESVRDEWAFDAATRERIRAYRLAFRLDQMACLPLFDRIDPTLDDREARAAEHRAFVEQYL
jgi:aminoglycoside phosphotransferase (APT) family kinase protein